MFKCIAVYTHRDDVYSGSAHAVVGFRRGLHIKRATGIRVGENRVPFLNKRKR
jgi:hypothetical protein